MRRRGLFIDALPHSGTLRRHDTLCKRAAGRQPPKQTRAASLVARTGFWEARAARDGETSKMTGLALERAWAYAFGLTVCALVAAPAFSEPTSDSYPLSTYPMFAYKREKTRLFHMDGLDRKGARSRLAPRLVANDEAMQAAQTVRLAVSVGPERMALLCQRVAERLALEAAYSGIVSVRVVEGLFDSLSYFTGNSEPEQLIVHYECAVPGRS